jgi:multidrug efflux pump subunit AcrA (membrane-fusion protein)
MSTQPTEEPTLAERALGSTPNPLDNIDHVFRHTARRTWLGVLGLALLLAAGVLWTAVAEQKVVVDAPAVIVPAEGIYTAGELQGGQVLQVLTGPDEDVRKDQVLARVQLAETGSVAEVRSPVDGRVLAVDVRAGESSPPGVPMFRIVPPGEPIAIAFYPAADVARLSVGQPVAVTVNGVAPDRFGRAVGRIESIGPIPASDQRLRQITGDSSLLGLVQRLGPLREVQVSLEHAATPSGFRWTGRSGPDAPVSVGTRAVAHITVGERTLLDRAFG